MSDANDMYPGKDNPYKDLWPGIDKETQKCAVRGAEYEDTVDCPVCIKFAKDSKCNTEELHRCQFVRPDDYGSVMRNWNFFVSYIQAYPETVIDGFARFYSDGEAEEATSIFKQVLALIIAHGYPAEKAFRSAIIEMQGMWEDWM